LNFFGNVHFLKCKFNLKRVFFFWWRSHQTFKTKKLKKNNKKTLDVSPENAFQEGTILLLSPFISNGMFLQFHREIHSLCELFCGGAMCYVLLQRFSKH
jgi:hypothetical protein